MLKRTFWVAASLGIGLLQAWDSKALSSEILPALLTLAGIAVPTAAIASAWEQKVRIAALMAGAMLLLGARVTASVPLNALHLALFPAALYILILEGLLTDGQRQSA